MVYYFQIKTMEIPRTHNLFNHPSDVFVFKNALSELEQISNVFNQLYAHLGLLKKDPRHDHLIPK